MVSVSTIGFEAVSPIMIVLVTFGRQNALASPTSPETGVDYQCDFHNRTRSPAVARSSRKTAIIANDLGHCRPEPMLPTPQQARQGRYL